MTVKRATGLPALAKQATPNPLIIITLLGDIVSKDDADDHEDDYDDDHNYDSDDGENRQHYQVMTKVVKRSVQPEWNDKILLPVVKPDMMILFTCVDWEGGSNSHTHI